MSSFSRLNILAGATAIIAMAAPVQSQAADFTIPSQPLATALEQLARQGKTQILSAPDLVEGKKSNAVSGNLTVTAALRQMLNGTGLSYRPSGAGFVIVAAKPVAAATVAPQAEATGAAGDEGVQDIVVTAQKRSQKLNDVGITILAASGDQLKTAGVTSVSQLTRITTGLSVGTSFSGYPVFSIRGVNFNANQFSAAPAVSTYIDEAALPYSAMTEGLLLDVERVEVLKGPQGTLFGQNATGGSINVVAAKPTATLGAGFNAEVNQFGQVMIEGYVSGPVTDNLRARFAASTTQFGAWQRGYYLNDRKNGDQNRGAARLLLDWTPTDRLKVSVNLNANYDHGEAIQAQFSKAVPVNPAGAAPGLIGYRLPTSDRDADIDPTLDTRRHNRLYQGVVRLDYAVGNDATLTSLTNYVNFKSRVVNDLDGTALPIFLDTPTGNDRTFSQELRLSGKALDQKLTYILGGNYQKDKITDFLDLNFLNYSTFPQGAVINDRFFPTSRTLAAFGNVEYQLAPKLTVLGGVRYTSNRETSSGCSYGNAQSAGLIGFVANLVRSANGLAPSNQFVPGGCLTINDTIPVNGAPDFQPIVANAVQKEHNVSWRAGLNYKPTSDDLLYALVSRGYKAGVFPVQTNIFYSAFSPVKQEKLTSYEVGAKLVLIDRILRANMSGFYYQYRNKQFFTYSNVPIIGPVTVVANVPSSSVKGFDADVTLTPLSGLTLRGAVTYIKTRVGNYRTTSYQGLPTDVTGSEFNFAPPWSASFDTEYRVPVSDGVKAFVGGSGLFNSRTFANLGESPTDRIPAYLVLDARIGLESHKGWKTSLFVRNLTNKYYWTSVIAAGDTNVQYAGLPRTFGVSAGFKF